MTKVTILGENPKEKKKKPIEFVRFIEFTGKGFISPTCLPSEFDSINVFKRTQKQEFDVFICYKNGTRYTALGDFNDGIVK